MWPIGRSSPLLPNLRVPGPLRARRSLPLVDEDAPAFHPDQGEDIVRVPRIVPQPFPRLDLVPRHDDQEAAPLLVQRAAELDEPLRDEAVDERGVLVPPGLFARIP